MKDRTREAVFNLLGPAIKDKWVFDLFAGTGALGLEALSRGARHATMIERHFPTARLIEKNIDSLELSGAAEVVAADTFFWARQIATLSNRGAGPWTVFCSPPYDMYVEQTAAVLQLLSTMFEFAPEKSLFVIEADDRFEMASLPAAEWDIRKYSPAIVAIAAKTHAENRPA